MVLPWWEKPSSESNEHHNTFETDVCPLAHSFASYLENLVIETKLSSVGAATFLLMNFSARRSRTQLSYRFALMLGACRCCCSCLTGTCLPSRTPGTRCSMRLPSAILHWWQVSFVCCCVVTLVIMKFWKGLPATLGDVLLHIFKTVFLMSCRTSWASIRPRA